MKFMPKLIVGLGNPGEEYKNTRHNIGFMVLDALAKRLNLKWESNKKIKSELAKNSDLILIKPQDFMNNSGVQAAAALSYFKLTPKVMTGEAADLSGCLMVIHDELDIEFGKYKISTDSRSAGHRGVESIISNLKTKNFKRLRIGVKTDALKNIGAEKFVMKKFNSEEKAVIHDLIVKILDNLIDF